MDISDFPDGGRVFRRKERVRKLCDGALGFLSLMFLGAPTRRARAVALLQEQGLGDEGWYLSPSYRSPVHTILTSDDELLWRAHEMAGKAGVTGLRCVSIAEEEGDRRFHGAGCDVIGREGYSVTIGRGLLSSEEERKEIGAVIGHEVMHALRGDGKTDNLRYLLCAEIVRSFARYAPKIGFAAPLVLGALLFPGIAAAAPLSAAVAAVAAAFGGEFLARKTLVPGFVTGVCVIANTANRQSEYMADLGGALICGSARDAVACRERAARAEGRGAEPETLTQQLRRSRLNPFNEEFLVTHPPDSRRIQALVDAFGREATGVAQASSGQRPSSPPPPTDAKDAPRREP